MSLIPVVRLGEPNDDDRKNFSNTVVDGIKVWYENSISPEKKEKPISIEGKRNLVTVNLEVKGAKE